jgi:iron complex outermembrane receptor protein
MKVSSFLATAIVAGYPAVLPLAFADGDTDTQGQTAASAGVSAAPSATAAEKPVLADAASGDLGGIATKNVIKNSQFDPAATNSYDSLRNVAGVESSDAKAGVFSDNLYIRGIHLLTTSSYRLDGGFAPVHIISLSDDKENIEVLKGANALLYGITSPGGIVNEVMKRPLAESYEAAAMSGTSDGQAMGGLDISRRFGPDGQFGVRFNAAGGHVETFVKDSGGAKGLASLAMDWDPSRRLSVRLDYEIYSQDVVQQAVLALPKAVNGVVTLPSLRRYDPTVLRSGLWSKNATMGQNLLLSTRYQLGNGWSTLVEGGYSDANRLRVLSQIASYNVTTGAGTITTTETPKTTNINTYLKAQFENQSSFWMVDNDFVFGVNRNSRDVNNPGSTQYTAKQNIYNPVTVAAPGPFGPLQYVPQNTNDLGYYFSDGMTFYNRAHLIGGARYLEYDGNYSQAGGLDSVRKSYLWSPSAGALFDLTKNLALYASYMKALSETGSAPLGAVNYPQVLPPEKSTQKEVGLRVDGLYGVTGSVGYFNFSAANTVLDAVTNVYEINGESVFKGIETSLKIQPARSLTINGSGLYFVDAVQVAPLDNTINGRRQENTPRLAGSLLVTYRPYYLVEGLALTGGVRYAGVKYVNPEDQATIPAFHVVDLNAAYTTRLNSANKATFTFGVNNALNDKYWSNAAEGALGVGAPRTFKASIKTTF